MMVSCVSWCEALVHASQRLSGTANISCETLDTPRERLLLQRPTKLNHNKLETTHQVSTWMDG